MNNYFGLLMKDISRLWRGLGFMQKLAILVLLIVTVVAISYFVAKSTEPNWAVLYSDLSEPDAVAVVEHLKKAGYSYKISDDKKSILVPADLKEELRIMIAQNDVIHDSNPGFELLDKLQLGATDFQNKLTRQRIFQGELTRTIEKISGIKKARVQLADPERSVFSDQDESPSASVMLILEPGVRLKQEQIKAIKNLVAYGVPRLSPDKVFVSDQFGSVLSDDVNNKSSDISDFRTNFENETAKKVQQVLEKIVGANNVSVEVSANMNFDSAKATIEKYTPNNAQTGVLTTTQSESEKYDKGASGQSLPAGSNDKNMNYEKTKVFNNYNVSKEIRQVVYAPGSVQKMTVAVALNKVLTSKEKDEIKNLVVSASGADMTRGDVVNITSMEFAANDEAATKNNQVLNDINKDSQLDFLVTKVAPLLVVLILGLSAIFVLNSLIKKPLRGQEVYERGEYYSEEEMEETPNLLEATSIPAIEARLDPELERMKSEINNIIMTNPSEASRLLLSFIRE